jgi:hypothetical protein
MADDLLNDKKKYPGIGWRWRFSAPDPPTRAGRVGRIRRPTRGPEARHHAGPGRSEEDGGGGCGVLRGVGHRLHGRNAARFELEDAGPTQREIGLFRACWRGQGFDQRVIPGVLTIGSITDRGRML